MDTYSREVHLPVSAAEAFAWHERPGAIDRLIPPWESVRVLQPPTSLDVGSRVELQQRLGPISMKWVAEHTEYEPGLLFRDRQESGPFSYWDHIHRFEANADGCVLRDEITYQPPGGFLGRLLGGAYLQRKIAQMFAFRHSKTEADLAAHARYSGADTMHVAVSGSSGLLGTELLPLLTTGGHTVTRLVRGEPAEGEVRWNPQDAGFDASALDGVDAVVHLAGENIAARRWSDQQKQRIRDSRVEGTRKLCEGLAAMDNPPKTLICASAIGFYGDRGDEALDETSTQGEGFLPDVAAEWEQATEPARAAGIRVVNLRFGVLLSPKDGALAKMLTPFKMGVGGVVGNGRQYWSWMSIDDAAGAILHSLSADISGPVNAVAPNPVTNHEFTKTLGKVLGRPTILPMPAFMAKLALGEMADALLLTSARVIPNRLVETGYEFRHATLESALRHLLGKNKL